MTELDAEVEGLYSEFQREKDDLLESIRFLNKQMLLKDTVIEAFIPAEEVQKVSRGRDRCLSRACACCTPASYLQHSNS